MNDTASSMVQPSTFGASPEIENVFALIDAYVDRYPHAVFQEAIRSQVAEVKEIFADLLSRRVRIRTVEQLRSACNGMFLRFAERARASMGSPAADVPKDRCTYRSACFLGWPDYFDSAFMMQMTKHRRLAFSRVFEDSTDMRKAITVEHVLIVPDEAWYVHFAGTRDELRAWWQRPRRVIDRLARHDQVIVVSHRALRESGNIDEYLDFGLYGDVAVGLYRRGPFNEELTLHDFGSKEFAQCRLNWDRFIHGRGSESLDWGEFKCRLEQA